MKQRMSSQNPPPDEDGRFIPSWFAFESRIRYIGTKLGEEFHQQIYGKPISHEESKKQNEFAEAGQNSVVMFFIGSYLFAFAHIILKIFSEVIGLLLNYKAWNAYPINSIVFLYDEFFSVLGIGVVSLATIRFALEDTEHHISKEKMIVYVAAGGLMSVYGILFKNFLKELLGSDFPAWDIIFTTTVLLFILNIVARGIDPENIGYDWLTKPLDVKKAGKQAVKYLCTHSSIRALATQTLLFILFSYELLNLLYQIRIDIYLSRIEFLVTFPEPPLYHPLSLFSRTIMVIGLYVSTYYVRYLLISESSIINSVPDSRSKLRVLRAVVTKFSLRIVNFFVSVLVFFVFAIIYNQLDLPPFYALFILLLVVGTALYLFLSFVFAPFIIIETSDSTRKAICRSWRIARGNRFSIIALEITGTSAMVIVYVLTILVLLLTSAIFSWISLSSTMIEFVNVSLFFISISIFITFRSFVYADGFDQLSSEETGIFNKKLY